MGAEGDHPAGGPVQGARREREAEQGGDSEELQTRRAAGRGPMAGLAGDERRRDAAERQEGRQVGDRAVRQRLDVAAGERVERRDQTEREG